MSDSTLLGLPAASTLDGSEFYYTVQNGTDRKVSGATLLSNMFNTLTITTPALSTTRGINIVQSLPSSGSQAGPIFLNSIAITNSGYQATGPDNEFWGLSVTEVYGGASTGEHGAILGTVNLNTTTNNAIAAVAVTGVGVASANAGGTGVGAGTSKGATYGMNPIGQLNSGATNFTGVFGCEADVAIAPGASAYLRVGSGVAGTQSGRGAGIDCGFGLWAGPGGGFKNGFLIHNFGGGAPVDTSGTILTTDGTAWTIFRGIDLSQGLSITDSAFISSGFRVDGSGNTQCGLLSMLGSIGAFAGGVLDLGLRISSIAHFGIFYGSGPPDKAQAKGSLYLRTDGTANNRLYIATDNVGTWTAFNTTS